VRAIVDLALWSRLRLPIGPYVGAAVAAEVFVATVVRRRGELEAAGETSRVLNSKASRCAAPLRDCRLCLDTAGLVLAAPDVRAAGTFNLSRPHPLKIRA
jgi:hypothetical protein